jgi:hypothetical protein
MNKPGLAYELAILVYDNQLVWVNGPFPAGQNDLQSFQKPGRLKGRIPTGKRVVGDKGYKDELQISTRNPLDTPAIKALKKRAKARHEMFNGRIKSFKILDECFCHGVAKHKMVFMAVCIFAQYDIENGHPMFDV